MLELIKTKIFRRQFLYFIVLITFMFTVILSAITVITKQSLEKQVLQHTVLSKEQVVGDLRRYLSNRIQEIKSYVISLEEYNTSEIKSAKIQNYLYEQFLNQDNFRSFGIINKEGIIVNSNLTEDMNAINLKDRDYFKNGMNNISSVSGFLVSKRNGDSIMIIAEPINLSDNTRHVLFGAIAISKMEKIIENFTNKNNNKVFLLDEMHNIVSTNYYNELMAKKVPNKLQRNSTAITALKSKSQGSGTYDDIFNIHVFGSYEWIYSLNIGVIVESDYEVAMVSYTSLVKIVILIAFVVYTLGICLSFLMSLQFIQPLNVIIKSVENFSNNNPQLKEAQPIEIIEDNELNDLVIAINEMQTKIVEREQRFNKLIIQLKEEKKNAAEANKLKSQFLANMSHELRTPLNSIIGFTRRVMKKTKDNLPKVQYENLAIVMSEAEHLLELINNLLDYSKIEAHRMDTYIESFNLVSVIDEISNMFNITLENSTLNYERELYSDNIPILSDRTKVKQILLNLISNAFKYSEKGTIIVSVTEQNDKLIIKVIDEGIGISNKDIQNIFDEFRQVDGSYTRKVGGTGLGLSITKKMTTLLQGSIFVNSEENVGSEFTVVLPKVYKKNTEQNVENIIIDRAYKFTNNKIVCVDDDLAMHKLYKQYFDKENNNVTYLTGKEDVIGVIEEIMPKAVLLDIMLPNKDGWDILAHIKSSDKLRNIAVIMVSVLNERKIAYHLKADNYLVKPVLREELIEAINKVDLLNDFQRDILIADDDDNFVSLAEQVLSDYVTDIRSASDGEIAIQKIKEKKPAILLLDIMMPKYNGFEVLEYLKKNRLLNDIVVIVITAKDLSDKEKQQLEDAADLILRKSGLNIEDIIPQILLEINK